MMSSGENSNEQRWKPDVEQAPNCPRCDSSNTKFCYYNNYSLTQPRYFCKGCRRYWTKGGSLRNVPVGGGCRKNRRGKMSRTFLNNTSVDGQTQKPSSSSLSSSSWQFQTNPAVRPGVILDDAMGINNGLNCTGLLSSPSSIADTAILDGSGIDLAVLYAKFSSNGTPNYQDRHHIEFGREYQQPTSIIIPSQDIPPLPRLPEPDFNTNCGTSSPQLIQPADDAQFCSSCMNTTLWDHDDPQQLLHTQFDFVPPTVLDDSSLLLDQNLINTSWNMNMFDSLCFEARS